MPLPRPTPSPLPRLTATRHGDPDGPRCVLLHGFTQTSACWEPVIDRLGPDLGAVALDLPGHGGSSAVRADLWGTAELAADGAGTGTWVGYSLGARVALHVALARPEVVERLVLVSGTAGLDGAADRAERRAADEQLATRLERIGLEAFLDEWLSLPLFAGIAPERACREARLRNTVEGLASSLRLCGTGTQQPLWPRLSSIAVPVTVVTGARDRRFTAVGRRMVEHLGGAATHVVIDDCGHTPPLEHPAALSRVIRQVVAR